MAGILFFLISLLASTIGSISGIGGGVIIKPVLDATGLLSVSTISFLSGCTVLIMATVSLLRGRNNGVQVDKRHSTPLAVGGAIGGIVGKWVFDLIRQMVSEENLVGAVQAGLLLVITIGVIFYIRYKEKIHAMHVEKLSICFLIGLGLGMVSSFLGIGGGPINIAVLYFFFSMEAKTAAKNSLYVIWFSQVASLLFSLATRTVPDFSWLTLFVMGIGGVLGALIGSAVVKKMKNQAVERIFMGLMAVIVCINSYNLLRFLG